MKDDQINEHQGESYDVTQTKNSSPSHVHDTRSNASDDDLPNYDEHLLQGEIGHDYPYTDE